MAKESKPGDSSEADNLFADYDEFAKVLRTWFVAYGVGGPVLLLTNEVARSHVATSGFARCIASDFLIGVGLQVLLALVNKTFLWLCYLAERRPERRTQPLYRVAEWFAYEIWIDLLVDCSSFVLFAYATYRVFMILTAP
jgi:hypothetical protein